MKKSFFYQVLITFLLILIIFSLLILLLSFKTIRNHYIETLSTHLKNVNIVLQPLVINHLKNGTIDELDTLITHLGDRIKTRITITDDRLQVIADSEDSVRRAENLSDRPELNEALRGEIGEVLRYSEILSNEILYVALPITEDEHIRGVIRTGYLLTEINHLLQDLKIKIFYIFIVIIVITIIIAAIFLLSITRPVKMLITGYRQIALGNFDVRLHVKTQDEFMELANGFNDMAEQLCESENAKKIFIENISHELKTPLTAIKGFAETIEENINENDKHYLDIIKSYTEKLISIVNNLLKLSQMESGYDFELEEVNLNELLTNALVLFEKRVQEKKLILTFDSDDTLPLINADPYLLEQMIINLLDNAIKYTDRGEIILSCRRSGNSLLLKCKDSGIGIPPTELTKVFERFYIADRPRTQKHNSTGLGLSIVKGIVELHNGEIELHSELEKGTTVLIRLPLNIAD